MNKNNTNKFKEFFATSWAIDNKNSIYVLVILITIIGYLSYLKVPKEQFPDIVIPTILVTTPYPGTSPSDMENLVSRPIEKEIKSLSGVKKVTSSSIQDFSSVAVEFNTDVDVKEAKQRVKDAVDKAKSKLPNNLPTDPNVMEIDFSEIPIMYIQVSGNFPLSRLKHYADIIQDNVEELKEITRADIIGALEREIQINVDIHKMLVAGISLNDIDRAIMQENMTISAGNIDVGDMKRTMRVVGQFKSIDELQQIVIKSGFGGSIYLRDIAEIKDSFKDQESFSRLNGKNVITVSIIKKSGQNLIDAADKIKEIIETKIKPQLPNEVQISVTGDMSRYTRNSLSELINSIIMGFLLVSIVLMFFMGIQNAVFVGLAVPLSMGIAFMIMPVIGFSMNMIVMFGFVFALGIVVDDAIVIIENTHRLHQKIPDIKIAAKMAAGEVFLPIFSGTLTTLAPFFPLAFWPGIVGQFMHYMPVTLIITLFASLFVAYVFNPVFAVDFMRDQKSVMNAKKRKKVITNGLVMFAIGGVFHLLRWHGMGNFMIIISSLYMLHTFFTKKLTDGFQTKVWPVFSNWYERQLRYFLVGSRPRNLLIGVIGLFGLTIVLVGVAKPKVVFFPENEPNTINVFIEMPVGTNQTVTDSMAMLVERRVNQALGENNPLVESIIANVAAGAGDGTSFDRSVQSHKAKVSINFVEHKFREGQSTELYLDKIRESIKDIPGAIFSVQKNKMGPPTGKPLSIEISGEYIETLVSDAFAFKNHLDSLQISGVEELKIDFQVSKPEIIVEIDRERAMREGISTAQVGLELRTAIYGKETSKYKEGEDEYPIQIRYSEEQRSNVENLMNTKISYRDMASGQFRQIPLSAVAQIKYKNSYGGINRKNNKRVITISSEVLSGFTPSQVMASVKTQIDKYPFHEGIKADITGEREDQKDATSFLLTAMVIAVGIIFFILITQFNSIGKTLIILSEVFFSIVGVLLGIIIFGMSISIVMTGLGVVALGGIVIRNGILIVEYIDELRKKGHRTIDAIALAGKNRFTPVLLTAISTILGLIPLAIGMDINFATLFTELNPHISFGGDNVMFWKNLSWTIIFGLTFASFLTLILVPTMYLIWLKMKISLSRAKSNRRYRKLHQ